MEYVPVSTGRGMVLIAQDKEEVQDLREAFNAMDEHVPEQDDRRMFVDNVLEATQPE